jgi:hypothetical protein
MKPANVATHTAPLGDLPVVSSLELEVLRACHEVTLHNEELVALIAEILRVPPSEVFYTWAWKLRGFQSRGALPGTAWTFFFHGLECDLANQADNRRLRVDFGPGGRLDTFTGWGVCRFVMSSGPPWSEFSALRTFMASPDPQGLTAMESLHKMGSLWDNLLACGLLESADQGLLDFMTQHTTIGPDGIRRTNYPTGTSDRLALDCAVAHRQKISSLGRRLLQLDAA